MKKYDVCLCEPFILPGILPTLGTPTLKAVLNEVGLKSVIFYPSLHLFAENRYYENDTVLKCISDIPLQFSEFLFNCGNIDEGITYLKEKIGVEDEIEINKVLDRAENILQRTAIKICNSGAKVLTYSLTFGDYNFAFNLFHRIKSVKDMTIVVGGSMCTPKLAKEIMTLCHEIDYVICDEDIETYQNLVLSIISEKTFCSDFVAGRDNEAKKVNKINDLNHLPCPDFTDFLREIEVLNLKRESVIVPYEISRGCWWGEKKSCAMCGYFGYQKCFLIKDSDKVISDLKTIKEKFKVNYIRFTDLVEPQRAYLKELEPVSELGLNFFWELRPNLNEEDISFIRNLEVFYSQIGFESLSTKELIHIHKGTTAINNIYLLILFMTYKIRIDWNYLYGFSDDDANWYESAMKIMPNLYHLFPPDLRKVWINRESRIFNESEKSELTPVGSKVFHEGFSDDIEVFYQTKTKDEYARIYEKLEQEIEIWKKNFSKGYQLCVVYDDYEGIHVMRDYGKEEHFYLQGIEAQVYACIFQPVSLVKLQETFGEKVNYLEHVLKKFIDCQIAIYLDGKYLALATRSTRYKWNKYNLLKSLFEK